MKVATTLLMFTFVCKININTAFFFTQKNECSMIKHSKNLKNKECNGFFDTGEQSGSDAVKITRFELEWLFKPNYEPNLVIKFCTNGPDVTSKFGLSVFIQSYVGEVYCSNLALEGSGGDRIVNRTHSVEISCSDTVKPGFQFTVHLTDAKGDRDLSKEITLPNCEHKAMKLTERCRAEERRKLKFFLHLEENNTVVATLDPTTYQKPFNTEIFFGIRVERGGWRPWGGEQLHVQTLTKPDHDAVFPNLSPGRKYRITAWRANEMLRYTKEITLEQLTEDLQLAGNNKIPKNVVFT